MTKPTEREYAKFGAYVAGILDGLIAGGDPEKRNVAISLILVGAERYNIELRPQSYYEEQNNDK